MTIQRRGIVFSWLAMIQLDFVLPENRKIGLAPIHFSICAKRQGPAVDGGLVSAMR